MNEEVQVEIIIRLMSNGQIAVTGPIQNKSLMYGLLECAKDAVRENVAKQPLVTPVTMGASSFRN